MVIFIALLSTKTIIDVIKFEDISYRTIEAYSLALEDVDPTCKIEDDLYTCDTQKNQLLIDDQVIMFYLDSRNEMVMGDYDGFYNVVLNKDKINVIFANNVFISQQIEDLPEELRTLDFSLQDSDLDAFEEQLFSGVSKLIASYKGTWGPGIILADMLSSLLLFMLFIMISSWMLKARFKAIPFKQIFVMTVYSSTALYIILILNSLYSLSIFTMFLLVIVAVRQNSQLSLELYRRLNKKP